MQNIRREKRDQHREQTEIDQEIEAAESKILKVTEFVTANEVATMMDVSVTRNYFSLYVTWYDGNHEPTFRC